MSVTVVVIILELIVSWMGACSLFGWIQEEKAVKIIELVCCTPVKRLLQDW